MLRGVILNSGGVLSLEPLDVALARLHALCGLDAVFAAALAREPPRVRPRRAQCGRLLVAGRRCDDELLRHVVAADVDSWAEADAARVAWIAALKDAGRASAFSPTCRVSTDSRSSAATTGSAPATT